MSHDVWDSERYISYDGRNRKARKPHTCDACHDAIAVGHVYSRTFIRDSEGNASAVVRCLRCEAIHVHLRKMGAGDTWPDERLACGETYEDHWGEPPPAEVARLAFMTADEAQVELVNREIEGGK